MKLFSVSILAALLGIAASASTVNDKVLDISGTWQFATDPQGVGVQQKWFDRDLGDTIELPGSMIERLKGDDVEAYTKWTGSTYDSTYYYSPFYEQYRQKGNVKFPFFLTPDKHYVGAAWYRRMVDIPADWQGSHITLFLERPHISTQVWVDGILAGGSNSLSVPHTLDLSALLGTPGRHTITVQVDNEKMVSVVAADSHSVSDQTQGNWNGIAGRMELQSTPRTYIDDIQIFPDLSGACAKVKITFVSPAAKDVRLRLGAASFNSDRQHSVKPVSHKLRIPAGRSETEITLPMGDFLAWDEFSPALYHLDATLSSDDGTTTDGCDFGMREFTIDGRMFRINGRVTQLRGTVESCCFPMTGYAPTGVEEWEAIFAKCREYGLNHMRFHSYCPPEAAFIAADRMGFYLQPEGPSWPNHGVGLGVGQPIDEYLMYETKEMVRTLGNHPSFCMLACGNEPAGRWVEWVSDFVDYWAATDSRRVYTGASVGGSWQWQPHNQFHVKAGARGLQWSRTRPSTLDDHQQGISQAGEPWVTHEMGQWCVFPNLDETVKYTGAYKARNFEIFRDILEANDMDDQAHDFLMASGYLQELCYKYDLERHMRTPQYAGFQLLALNDYSGQGSAIVGVLDVLWGEKGYCDAASWRRFCSPVVPLAKIEKFVYRTSETLHADLLTTNYGPADLGGVTVGCVVRDDSGEVVKTFALGAKDIATGGNTELGSIDLALAGLPAPAHYSLELRVGAEGCNDWDFWVYPDQVEASAEGIYVCSSLDDKAVETLRSGGDVLVLAPQGVSAGRGIQQQFLPVFWNTSWFMMKPPHTTGILLDESHPLWRGFPTASHSDLQWWELVNQAPVMQFTDFPQGFRPLVQSIDTWFLSRKIGSLFEARVLGGRLIMSTMDLEKDLGHRPAAAQMRAAILQYMHSADFNPAYSVPLEDVQGLFTRQYAPAVMFTKATPDELAPKAVK